MGRKSWLCGVLACALTGAALGSAVTMTGTTTVQTNAAGEKEVVVKGVGATVTLNGKDEKPESKGAWKELLKAAEAGKEVTVDLVDGKLSRAKAK